MPRSANQQDLARAAGVSVSTVSRALSNARGISAELRARIVKLAQELGYQGRGAQPGPGRFVRAYVTANVMSGGLVAFYSAVMEGIAKAARSAGLELQIRLVQHQLDPARLQREADEMPADGTLLVGIDLSGQIEAIFGPQRPMVLVNTFDPQMRYDSVAPNNFYGAAWATRLLLEAGHRHILHLRDQIRWTTLQREQGFLSAIAGVSGAHGEILDIRDDGDRALEAAARARKAGKSRWTAVFSVHDNGAIRLIHALENVGLAVPGDVSVIGFDDLPPAAMMTPRLSTMRVDCAAIGQQAIALMLRRLDDPGAAVVQVETAVSPVTGGTIAQIS
ncbi:MAG TPA: LacI family DNA-binding transcriptional regulator [Devosia sp.]|nr:LacI family DNA-binding transcriptional regulator [Devosia sp.]